MEIKLPTSKVPAEASSPRNLIIFSKPKTGKTTLLSQLDNCLILDLEKGSKYLEALKVEANSIEEIKHIGKAIKEAGNPYTYIAVDTITALEENSYGKELAYRW
jgi:stage III sporulation protein SpoIIIAA